MNRIASLLAIATLLAACAAGPQFSGIAEPVGDQADVYLYRGSDLFAAGQSFDVTLDGKEAGKLYNASFLHLRMPAGSHTLTVAPGGLAAPKSTVVRAEAGKTLFFQFDFHYELYRGTVGNSAFPNAAIEPRKREIALTDLKELKAAK